MPERIRMTRQRRRGDPPAGQGRKEEGVSKNNIKLSDRICDAQRRHRESYPNGDWKAVNVELGALFWEAFPILVAARIDPWAGGNEGRATALKKLGF